jgi:hypothetical protein
LILSLGIQVDDIFCFSSIIALFESHLDRKRPEEFQSLLEEPDEYQEPEEDPEPWHGENDNGEADEFGEPEEEGREISKVKFEDLKKKMPSLTRSVSGEILWQVSREPLPFLRQPVESSLL